MGGFVFPKVLVGKNLEKDTVGVPGCAAANEFAISCSKRIENCIVEVLIISNEIKFIRINHIKRWSSDCFGVVRESLNAASVNKMDPGLLGLIGNAWRKLMCKGCYALYDSLGLPPRWPHNADCSVWMCNRVL